LEAQTGLVFLAGTASPKTGEGTMGTLEEAAKVIEEADALLITTGAGMGVDSGLPDFRGSQGFWKAYPPYKKLNVSFSEMASPDWFKKDPEFAWGFYGQRRNLYRVTEPHNGYAILKRWAEEKPKGYFAVTSNVDNAFQKAGFDASRIAEVHGTIEWNQCMTFCGARITPAGPEEIEVDTGTMRASGALPTCPGCGEVTRPNIMMFGDPYFDKKRQEEQLERFYAWLKELKTGEADLVVVECGAGVEIPTIRDISDQIGIDECGGTLVRVNPVHSRARWGSHVSLHFGALEALEGIEQVIAV